MSSLYKTDPNAISEVESLISPQTFAIHYHNKFGRSNFKVINQMQPLFQMMKKHCPLTVENMIMPFEGRGWFESLHDAV